MNNILNDVWCNVKINKKETPIIYAKTLKYPAELNSTESLQVETMAQKFINSMEDK